MSILQCILCLFGGGVLGAFLSLLIAGAGTINKQREWYQEGFMDGYNEAKKGKNNVKE